MANAEAEIRKAHKRSGGTDRLVNAARLAALEKNIGVPVRRHRDPGDVAVKEPDQKITKETEDEVIFLKSE